MKHYEAVELVIVEYTNDMITTSAQGVFEGLNYLDSSTNADWFD